MKENIKSEWIYNLTIYLYSESEKPNEVKTLDSL